MKSILSLFALVLLVNLASADSVEDFLSRFTQNPARVIRQLDRTHGATVMFPNGREIPLDSVSSKLEDLLQVPTSGWEIEVDGKEKMAWFNSKSTQDASEGQFEALGGVLLRHQSGEWYLQQLNVTRELPVIHKRKAFEISAISFNIRYGTAGDGSNSWYNRDYLVFKVFTDYRPTFVGVQEALFFQLEEISANVAGYKWIGVGRDDGKEAGEFSAIFYDPSVVDFLQQGTFWYCSTPDVPACTSYGNSIPRIATWGYFRHRATGETFYHYNTHFDHESVNSRERSAEQLIAHINQRANGDPFFITGDFNNGLETSNEIVTIKNSGFDDSFRVLHPNATNVGTFNGFIGTATGTKIDFVFTPRTTTVGGPAQIFDAKIIQDNDNGRYPSDHFPVYARFSLP